MADIVAELLAIGGSTEHPYAQPAAVEIHRLRSQIRALLMVTAKEIRDCRLCGIEVAFVIHASGATGCYTMDGTPHMSNCREAGRIRRRAEKNAAPGSLFS